MGSSHKQMIGSITEFNSDLDDWNVYYERLEQFFEVNEVPDEKRSAFLISVIGSEAYKSLRDLCHPYLPRDKPFEHLCELLRKQFTPQIAIFRERVKFYNARQEPHENVTQWYGKLKRLSVDCKFGSNLQGVLLDKFITGLRPGQVLDRLCEESEVLQLEQALDIAVNKECSAKENAYAPFVAPPRVQKSIFGGEPVRAQLAVCPPAPESYRLQANSGLFGGQMFKSAPSVAPVEPQAFSFGSVAAPPSATCLFGASNGVTASIKPLEAEGVPPVGLCAKNLRIAADTEEEQRPQEEEEVDNGLPEGANPAGGPAAKGRRIRTRRRGRARRGGAGGADDQHSVEGMD